MIQVRQERLAIEQERLIDLEDDVSSFEIVSGNMEHRRGAVLEDLSDYVRPANEKLGDLLGGLRQKFTDDGESREHLIDVFYPLKYFDDDVS